MLSRSLLARHIPKIVLLRNAYSNVCPPAKSKPSGGSPGTVATLPALVRQERSGKCRLGFIPDEWFLFFHPFTGVSGPYILLIGITNYCFSKEIMVMEHEYYNGLSIALLLIYGIIKGGPLLGAALDKQVDEVVNEWQKGRTEFEEVQLGTIKNEKTAQWQAQGQELLMKAKKENIEMQLEAAYRARMMTVYNAVKGRLEYHVRRHAAETRIQQKYMIDWILDEVTDSITPEFEQQVMDQYIKDLGQLASKA